MAKVKGLGRGLDVLFGDDMPNQGVVGIRINDIEPNPTQPRRFFDESSLAELSESISKNGVISPITLRKTGETYQIIAGERRWRASRMAGLKEIPAIVLEVNEQAAYELALIENLQREDLNPIEEAEGFARLIDEFAMTQDQAAEKVGRSRPAVANALRLLSLPPAIKASVEKGSLSAGHGRALLSITDKKLMEQAAKQVIERQLSVRETERLCKTIGKEQPEKKKDAADIYIRQLERDMSSKIGHKITISHGGKKGRITVEYYGNDDLETLCDALGTIKK